MKLRSGVLLAAAFVVILTSMTSCVRTYYCQYEITHTGQPGLPEKHINEYEIKDTRRKLLHFAKPIAGSIPTTILRQKKTVSYIKLFAIQR